MGGCGATERICSCQPTLDIINKFHHLDLDEAFIDHMVEEVHHCIGTIDSKKPKYKVIHCGCKMPHTCEKCTRKRCVARLTHAIDKEIVEVDLHIDFIGEELTEILKGGKGCHIKVRFGEECPKNKGMYHVNDSVDCYGGFIEFIEMLEQDVKLRDKMRNWLSK